MRTTTLLCSLIAASLLAGCPSSTTPADGGDGSNPSDIVGSDASPLVQQLCGEYYDFETRCGLPACAVADFQAICPTALSHYRTDALTLVQSCVSSVQCSMDGGASFMSPNCNTQTIYAQLMPTQAQRDAAAALCNACPRIDGVSSTPDTCIANIFTLRDGGSSGIGEFLLLLDDPTARQAQAECALTSAPDAGSTCSLPILLCVFRAIGYDNLFHSSCSDAGHD